jgi:acetylornithine deacetylase/succinyl-diaminopimelate desuccinylase-like protein
MLDAGYKVNVIPTDAVAHVDGRVLPGYEEEFDTADLLTVTTVLEEKNRK